MKIPLTNRPSKVVGTSRKRAPNRTVQTGSRLPVSQTFSYHSNRAQPQANVGRSVRQDFLQPAAQKIGGYWLQRFGLGILLIVSATSLISVSSLSSQVNLKVLKDAGNIPNAEQLYNSPQTYQKSASELLSKSVLNNNKITVNTTQVTSKLLEQYPELASASLTIPLISHKPVLAVTYEPPALIIHNTSGSFVVGSDGRALVSTTSQAVSLGLPSVLDQTGYVLAANKPVLSSEDVRFITTVIAGLSSAHKVTSDMVLPQGTRELQVTVAGEGYYTKYNLNGQSAKLQVGTYLATAKKLAASNKLPGKYMDVRVDGRAYYQ